MLSTFSTIFPPTAGPGVAEGLENDRSVVSTVIHDFTCKMSSETPLPNASKAKKPDRFQPAIDHLVDLIKSGRCQNIVIVAGAGMSVAAGIPDFRSASTGLYATLSTMAHLEFKSPLFVFDYDQFKHDPRPFWWIFSRMWPRGEFPKPTTFHYLIALLERHNLLRRCFTQNVDGLEASAGVSAERLCYCHGVLTPCHCIDCKAEVSFPYCISAIKSNMERNPTNYKKAVVPTCPHCQGNHVKPDVVFFGEGLPRQYFRLTREDFPETDLALFVGTTLEVYPVADLPNDVPAAAERFVINRENVRAKGGKLKQWWDSVKTKLSPLGNDYTGQFDYGNDHDWWIGGDMQDAAMRIIEGLGWQEEFEELKREGDARQHQIQVELERTGD